MGRRPEWVHVEKRTRQIGRGSESGLGIVVDVGIGETGNVDLTGRREREIREIDVEVDGRIWNTNGRIIIVIEV